MKSKVFYVTCLWNGSHFMTFLVPIHYCIGTGNVMKCDLFHSRSAFRPVECNEVNTCLVICIGSC